LMGKQNMYDHSVRVPFMIVGPGLAKDKRIDSRIYLQDVMPTSLELGGAEIPEYVQFKSIMPLLAGTAEQSYDAIYGGYTNTQRMVTVGDHKLIVYPKIRKTLLFDLKNDPWETEDLAEKPEFADKVAELKARLKALQVETGDTLDLDAPATASKPSPSKPARKKQKGKVVTEKATGEG
jgi:arylsulfatase A-like enzyme